jgi:hypothetical protein
VTAVVEVRCGTCWACLATIFREGGDLVVRANGRWPQTERDGRNAWVELGDVVKLKDLTPGASLQLPRCKCTKSATRTGHLLPIYSPELRNEIVQAEMWGTKRVFPVRIE